MFAFYISVTADGRGCWIPNLKKSDNISIFFLVCVFTDSFLFKYIPFDITFCLNFPSFSDIKLMFYLPTPSGLICYVARWQPGINLCVKIILLVWKKASPSIILGIYHLTLWLRLTELFFLHVEYIKYNLNSLNHFFIRVYNFQILIYNFYFLWLFLEHSCQPKRTFLE